MRFSDAQLESSAVVVLFLSLLRDGELTWPDDGGFDTAEAYCDLVAFMRKYDAERLLKTLRLQVLNDLLLHYMPPFYTLMIAAAMDDVELSILAFKHRHTYALSQGCGWPIEPEFISAELMSLAPAPSPTGGTWPAEVLHRFPIDYLWASSQAWTAKWGSQYAAHKATEKSEAMIRDQYSYGSAPKTDKVECSVDIAREYETAIRSRRPLYWA